MRPSRMKIDCPGCAGLPVPSTMRTSSMRIVRSSWTMYCLTRLSDDSARCAAAGNAIPSAKRLSRRVRIDHPLEARIEVGMRRDRNLEGIAQDLLHLGNRPDKATFRIAARAMDCVACVAKRMAHAIIRPRGDDACHEL